MTAITQETLSVSGVLLAKVFDRQQAETERYAAENARQADLQVRQTMTGQSFFATVQAFFGLTPALVYLVAGLSIGGVFLAAPWQRHGGAAGRTPAGARAGSPPRQVIRGGSAVLGPATPESPVFAGRTPGAVRVHPHRLARHLQEAGPGAAVQGGLTAGGAGA
ncbi:MAG TPA: hypothetical protein VLJ85_21620 [Geodermatophilus sp.]|jgi:hypothetical protein|nr:hypothetical protein [Geodermatophilus sp.]